MPEETKTPPPIDQGSSGTAIHLAYIRRDIDDIKSTLTGLKNGYVTRIDFEEHLKADADHEARIRTLETALSDLATIKKLVYGCAGLVLTLVASGVIYLLIPHD